MRLDLEKIEKIDMGDWGWSAERIWSAPATERFKTDGFSGVNGRAATERDPLEPDREPEELSVDEVELKIALKIMSRLI